MTDVRWLQRFDNFKRAFKVMAEGVQLAATRPLSEMERQGLIQSFEFTHELAWNVLKDFLEDKGVIGLMGSKDSTRAAFKRGLIDRGDDWMKMIEDRNLTSHTYNVAIADRVIEDILSRFHPAFTAMAAKFDALARESPE
jgi:nucleotidyltransferase substrate binding protein (TIGR01987 family)